MSLTAEPRSVETNGGSIVVILLVTAGVPWRQCGWHSRSNSFLGSLLPTKAYRSRGRGAKPQVRSHRSPDSWVAEERAGPAPGEQALQTGEGHVDVDIAG